MFPFALPVIRLSDWTQGTFKQRQQISHDLGKALQQFGFFILIEHGIERLWIQEAYTAAAQFFALPETLKARYEDPATYGQRGYTPMGREHARDSAWADLKEFWHVGREAIPGQASLPYLLPNIWPLECPKFQPALSQLYQALDRCGSILLEACAVFLGESPEFFREKTQQSDSILRVIHYPPLGTEAHSGRLRSAAHEDINLITLLCEATASGLQIWHPHEGWLDIEVLPGQIVVDAGDMLQHWSNGLFKSTTHRVINPPAEFAEMARYSMPFFVHPRREIDLSPLPSCLAQTGGFARYSAMTAGQYLEQRLREIGLLPPTPNANR